MILSFKFALGLKQHQTLSKVFQGKEVFNALIIYLVVLQFY